MSAYRELGVELLCIVGQKGAAVTQYFAKMGYAFPILIDEDRSVIRSFEVYHALGLDAFQIARPSLFVIGEDGRIRFGYVGKNQFDNPPTDPAAGEIAEALQNSIPRKV